MDVPARQHVAIAFRKLFLFLFSFSFILLLRRFLTPKREFIGTFPRHTGLKLSTSKCLRYIEAAGSILKYVEQKTDILGDVFVSQMQINQQQLGQISFQIMLLSAFNFLLSQQVFCISPERCYFFRRPGYFRQISRSHKMKTSLLQLEFRHAGALS